MLEVEFGHQGWVRVNGVDDVVVLAKTEEFRGRRVIVDLVIVGDPHPGVTAATLKITPMGWLEGVINTDQARQWLAERQSGRDRLTEAIRVRSEEAFLEQLPSTGWSAGIRLERPDGSDPEGFYRRVADAYNAAVTRSANVAPILAAEADVPVATVHRWISEARRRGFLPPARRGRRQRGRSEEPPARRGKAS